MFSLGPLTNTFTGIFSPPTAAGLGLVWQGQDLLCDHGCAPDRLRTPAKKWAEHGSYDISGNGGSGVHKTF